MAEVIQFPKRTETQTLHFDEKHAFGEIGRRQRSIVAILIVGRDVAKARHHVALGAVGIDEG